MVENAVRGFIPIKRVFDQFPKGLVGRKRRQRVIDMQSGHPEQAEFVAGAAQGEHTKRDGDRLGGQKQPEGAVYQAAGQKVALFQPSGVT